MALSAGCHVEVRTTGSDTICSGAFDPTQTAGMFTDGAATSANTAAPVFSSASYNFVAGDVDAYLFIGAGTNWTKGWYKIASVASNQATLTATALGYQSYSDGVNTAEGCASVASPTGATWSIDYSQQAAAEITYTDLSAAGAGSTFTSAGTPFTAALVGNAVRVTGGTNCTTGHHVITSVAAGVATFNNAVTTGATSNGAGRLGGALATPGYSGGIHIAGNSIWIAPGTYTITTASNNVANGRFTGAAGSATAAISVFGYTTVRGDDAPTRPAVNWGVNGGSTNAFLGNSYFFIGKLNMNGNRGTYTNAFSIDLGPTGGAVFDVKLESFSGVAPYTRVSGQASRVEVTDCAGNGTLGGTSGLMQHCYFHDTGTGAQYFTSSNYSLTFYDCIFDTMPTPMLGNNTSADLTFQNCVFYNITGAGISFTSAPINGRFINCIFVNCSTYGVSCSAVYQSVKMVNCAFYNNTSGKYQNILSNQVLGEITLTADPFVAAATGDFRLNMKTGGGALLRGAGYPQTFPGLTWAHRRDIGAHQHSGPKRGING